MRVGIHAKFFMDWGGGVDFLRLIIRGLKQIQKNEEIHLTFLIPNQHVTSVNLIKDKVKKIMFSILRRPIISPKLSTHNLLNSFSNEGVFEWVYYPDNKSSFKEVCVQNNLDVILPCFWSLGKDFPIPWIGYIFDFQHKHFPNWFSDKDVEMRNKQFDTTLNESDFIIVNSKSVAKDIESFYAEIKPKIISLPFTPLFDFSTKPLGDLKYRFNLKDTYFLVSNQFWKHKNHITLFEAMGLLKKSHPNIQLVCTGEMKDYRNPDYINQLKNKIDNLGIKSSIIFTGYISKSDQKSLMYNAKAVIQPTLFEGGPGGGSVYEALGMGIPVVLSDIPVNREIDSSLVLFFESLNAKDLAQKMIEILNVSRMSENELISYHNVTEQILGSTIKEVVTLCQNTHAAKRA